MIQYSSTSNYQHFVISQIIVTFAAKFTSILFYDYNRPTKRCVGTRGRVEEVSLT